MQTEGEQCAIYYDLIRLLLLLPISFSCGSCWSPVLMIGLLSRLKAWLKYWSRRIPISSLWSSAAHVYCTPRTDNEVHIIHRFINYMDSDTVCKVNWVQCLTVWVADFRSGGPWLVVGTSLFSNWSCSSTHQPGGRWEYNKLLMLLLMHSSFLYISHSISPLCLVYVSQIRHLKNYYEFLTMQPMLCDQKLIDYVISWSADMHLIYDMKLPTAHHWVQRVKWKLVFWSVPRRKIKISKLCGLSINLVPNSTVYNLIPTKYYF